MNQSKEINMEKKEGTAAETSAAKTFVLKDTDIIEVKSLVPMVYYTDTKTMDSFMWGEAGDIQEMTFAQLKLMKTKHEGYFAKRWLYPMNEMVCKRLGIEKYYQAKFEAKDISLLYGNDVEAVRGKISFLTPEEKAGLIEKVRKGVKGGKIQNISILRLLERELNVDLISDVP